MKTTMCGSTEKLQIEVMMIDDIEEIETNAAYAF